MRKLSIFCTLMALLATSALAAQLKLPLTTRFSGGQHYLEWTGTNYGVSSSDTLTLYSDTSGTPDAVDPIYFFRSTGPARYGTSEASQPGHRACQSYVIEVVAHSEADGATAKFSLWKANSTEGTLYQDSTTYSSDYSGATNDVRQYAFPYSLQRYAAPKLQVTSATDSVVLQRFTLWCSDRSLVGVAVTINSNASVASIDRVDSVLVGTTMRPVKYAIIDAAASGDNTLLAAVASNKIRVLSLFMVAAGAVNVRFESGAGGTALSGQMNLTTNSGFTLPYNKGGWFETATNTLLNLELSGAVSVDGSFSYVEVP